MHNGSSEFKVLLIEDDISIQTMLTTYLSANGAEVVARGDGRDIVAMVNTNQPDIILLDVVLPYTDGFTLLQQIRLAGIKAPVIMLTEKGAVEEKVMGLDLGADDYVTKPFSSRELLARITSQLRRYRTASRAFCVGGLKIDPTTREIRSNSNEILQLTKTEFDLFLQLARKCPQVVSHAELFTEVLGYKPDVETKALVMHIANVRRKLSSLNMLGQVQIQSVAGVGYKLVEQAQI
jgi:DNA-binding response OmpR family regulator